MKQLYKIWNNIYNISIEHQYLVKGYEELIKECGETERNLNMYLVEKSIKIPKDKVVEKHIVEDFHCSVILEMMKSPHMGSKYGVCWKREYK